MRTFWASTWDVVRNMVEQFTAAFQEWWLFSRTRTPFTFKKFPGYLFWCSAIITYAELFYVIFYPERLPTMSVVLLLIPLLVAPILLSVIIFVHSLRGKWRNDFDGWARFGELSNRERLVNCETRLNGVETKLSSIESILRDTNDKLDKLKDIDKNVFQ